jgi:hypothetical protein
MSYGLQIMDASSNIIFDSDYRITRVIGIYTLTVAKNSPVFTSVSGMVDDGTWGTFATGLATSTVDSGGFYTTLAYGASYTAKIIVFRF